MISEMVAGTICASTYPTFQTQSLGFYISAAINQFGSLSNSHLSLAPRTCVSASQSPKRIGAANWVHIDFSFGAIRCVFCSHVDATSKPLEGDFFRGVEQFIEFLLCQVLPLSKDNCRREAATLWC